ncbi:NlpC/P60 family protein [Pseudonocardia sulfidoxydans]|uniref:NlpC/P60 family protein n=1 Tax=Pseudonocardia sulfidoxydans TaxID=54011 RepID=UPI0035A23273
MTTGDDGWARPDPSVRGGRHRARGRRRVDHDGVAAAWLLAALLGTAACALPSAVPVRPAAQQSVLTDRPVPLPTVPAPHHALPLPVTPGPTPAQPVAAAEEAPADFTSALPDDRAAVAVRTAMAQIGLPYQWGGNGPTAGDDGFDCSGLTTFAYAAAGIPLPRTAATQYAAGPHVPAGAPLQPGDLVFYGTPGAVHHVGMYIGDGRMVNAPTFGEPVQTAYYRWTGDDYLGATRPAATGPITRGLLPTVPSEGGPVVRPPRPTVFEAPPAPPPTEVPQPATSLPPEPVTAASAVAAGDTTTTSTTLPPTSVGADPSSTTDTTTEAPPATSASTAESPTTVPPTTASSTTGSSTTVPSTTLAPTSAEPPTTTAQPPTTTRAPQLVVGDDRVPLVAVAAPATGVPAAPQAGGRTAETEGRTVVVLAADGDLALQPGGTVTVRSADGAARTWTIRVVRPLPEPALTPALAPAGGLVVVMGGPGARTVAIAT